MTSIWGSRTGHSARLLAAIAGVTLVIGAASPAHASAKDDAKLVNIDAGPAQIELYGLLQGQLALYTGKDNLIQDGDPAERIGARLRRARLGFEGWLFGSMNFELTVEATQKSVQLLDAWMAYRQFKWLNIELGADKVPFSRFQLFGSSDGALIERPVSVTAMAPDRQVGLTLSGSVGDGLFSYAVGVYNGFERNTNFYEGYVENPAMKGNRFNRLAYAGRIELAPFGPIGKNVADLEGGKFRLGVGAAAFYNDGDTTSTTGWEADLIMKVHGFHFIAEYIGDMASPKHHPTTTSTIPSKLKRMGLTGEAGYVFWPEHMGVNFRAEWVNDDMHIKNNGDSVLLTPGLSYYWHRQHVKVQLDYTHRLELYGANRDNDTLLMQVQLAL